MKFFILLLFITTHSYALSVVNISYTTQTDEKVLRLDVILPLEKTEIWKIFTTDDELIQWIAPVAHIELKTGG